MNITEKIAIILKHIALYVFGVILLAGFFTIVQWYDKSFKADNIIVSIASVSYGILIYCKGYLEFNKQKK